MFCGNHFKLNLWSISWSVTECFCLYFQGIRPSTKVVMKIVSCPPTVQVSVNRPDTKYQLGFSVQNGMVKRQLSL